MWYIHVIVHIETFKLTNKKRRKKIKSLPNKAFIDGFIQILCRKKQSIYVWLLFSVCKDGYYGHMCNINCGRCKDGHACDKHNGSCYNGCVPNFQQPNCEGFFYNHFIFEKKIFDLVYYFIDAFSKLTLLLFINRSVWKRFLQRKLFRHMWSLQK